MGLNKIGQYFTPDYIAKFMAKNAKNYYCKFNKVQSLDNITVLEPSAGEGVFLEAIIEEGFSDITSYELDDTLKNSLITKFPKVNFHFNNFLGSNTSEKFDLIIGNPPYLGQNYNAEVFQELVNRFPICKKYFVGNMDLFYYFIHLGILKLNPGGILSFITTNYWITKSKKTGIKHLKPHIVDDCFFLQYIDLSPIKIFKEALGQHNCIFVLQKKYKNEKEKNLDKNIDIVQVRQTNNNFENFSSSLKYQSAITNKDLSRDSSWILKYPLEVKTVIDKIENFCRFDDEVSYIIDYYDIRNGLILIKDDVFILKENLNFKIVDSDMFIKVKDDFVKINDAEKQRLKMIFKSKAIGPFSYNKRDLSGFLIYFNKQEFKEHNVYQRNKLLQKKYPNLTSYLNQYKDELEEILINAKENSADIYFPRRGSFIKQTDLKNIRKLINLEPYYEASPKIFFSYISKSNVFGYTKDSYYATSDTYFLWPKERNIDIEDLFLLAFLNSKLVNFLFRAKNIKIKRSKTKLEDEIPIPNITLFQSKYQVEIINLIRYFASCLIENKDEIDFSKFHNLKVLSPNTYSQIRNEKSPRRVIDVLIFALFDLSEKDIDFLVEEYYS